MLSKKDLAAEAPQDGFSHAQAVLSSIWCVRVVRCCCRPLPPLHAVAGRYRARTHHIAGDLLYTLWWYGVVVLWVAAVAAGGGVYGVRGVARAWLRRQGRDSRRILLYIAASFVCMVIELWYGVSVSSLGTCPFLPSCCSVEGPGPPGEARVSPQLVVWLPLHPLARAD